MDIRCTRCGKKLTGVVYNVLGYPGRYGLQCALEVCQGNENLLRKAKPVIERFDPQDEDCPLPF